MKKTVLITTSGIGERLGVLTKYTNKSLINVGDKYGLCYIIENYEIETNFIITIGYYGSLVKDFLLMAYPLYNFTFVFTTLLQSSAELYKSFKVLQQSTQHYIT